MAECNVSLPFQCTKVDEKLCKYSYSSWCPTCDKDSPRRRAKSESVDQPCRRKGKDMKNFTPKKFDHRHQEYENMDLDFDQKDLRIVERVRSNLCELPTSYITNNVNKTDLELDFETEKLMKSYQNGISKCFLADSKGIQMKRNQIKKTLVPIAHSFEFDTQPSTRSLIHNSHVLRPPAKHADCFETCTFFDKQFDTIAIKERYARELEILREKLRDLRSHRYNTNPPMLVKNLDENVKEQPVPEIKVIEVVPKPRIDGEVKHVPSCRRISVKTKGRMAALRNAKFRSKPMKPQISEDSSESSDLEGSEREDFEDIREVTTRKTKPLHETGFEKPLLMKSLRESTASKGAGDAPVWPLRDSLFPNIPPYIRFNRHDDEPNNLPAGRRFLKWKLSNITPIVVRKTLTNTGFRLVRKSNEWMGTWGKHMKSPMFRTLKTNQKLNHFAGTFQLGRKDRLWKNLQRLMQRYGTKEFGIIPQTYVLPYDLRLLKQQWEFKDGSGGEKWIIKPPASARGVGIKVINKWSQLPKQSSLIVQRYISDPYLINGSKFDLRLYVLVTSFNPMRIYLYPEGLVRFASVKYSDDDKDLKDRYMHLTNYSINKLSSQYTANEDANSCQGHKWTLSKLWEYMDIKGIDTKALWTNLQHLVIKTMISGESPISQLCTENVQSRYNCYELFGVDVLLDERLKPWLLEVNISPSLHSTSPLDLHVKGPLVQTLFNMAQFQLPSKLGKVEACPPCYDYKIYTTTLTKKEINKHNYFAQVEDRKDYLEDILVNLTGDDVRFLTQAEDELTVKGEFERIFPTKDTYGYLEFLEPRYYNKLFDAWETKYENNRKEGISRLKILCAKRVHLKVAPASSSSKNSLNMNPGLEKVRQVPSTEGQSHPEPEVAIKTEETSSAQKSQVVDNQ